MGPPTGSNGNEENVSQSPTAIEPSTKRRHLETIDRSFLPSSDYYNIAHLCDSPIIHITISEPTETIITSLADGSCVFWKRSEADIIPVKRLFVHNTQIIAQASDNSFKTNLVTIARRGGGGGGGVVGGGADSAATPTPTLDLVVWDIANIDVARKETISDFSDITTIFYLSGGDRHIGVATSDALWLIELSHEIKPRLIKKGFKTQIFSVLSANSFNISIFKDGTIDYWMYASESKPYALPTPEHIDFTLRLRTHLYELKKRKILSVDQAVINSTSTSFALSVTTAEKLGRIFIYNVRSGMIEDEFECGKGGGAICFDKTGRYLYHKGSEETEGGGGGGLSIRDVDLKKSFKGPGGGEETGIENYTSLCYYASDQEDKIPGITSAMKAGSATEIESILICGLSDRLIIYAMTGGDVLTEMRERISEMLVRRKQLNQAVGVKPMLNDLTDACLIRDPDRAVIYTTVGDIGLKLEPTLCPKTVENFAVHAQSHYYDGTIFHRVIQDFMIQGGDPNGDGSGGESIWGGYFQDEFNDDLNHNLPFVLSMANGGPSTNGSQFFITTIPCPFLNKKHTVFGHCVRGQDVVKSIESVKTNINDKPLRDIRIITIKVSKSESKKS